MTLQDRWRRRHNIQSPARPPAVRATLPAWAAGLRAALAGLTLLGLWWGFVRDAEVFGRACGSPWGHEPIQFNTLVAVACSDARSTAGTTATLILALGIVGLVGMSTFQSRLNVDEAERLALEEFDSDSAGEV